MVTSAINKVSLTRHWVLKVQCEAAMAEILMPLLADLGFDTFEESDAGFTTSQPAGQPLLGVAELLEPFEDSGAITYSIEEIEGQNWNAIWEASITPVVIADNCVVRAAFHEPDPTVQYDLIITPKMAFGTGHHATTAQVMRYMLKHDLMGYSILDAGSGSGVLAILAEKLGANRIYAYDYDPWCYESIAENVAGNACKAINFGLGTIRTVEPGAPFNWVIANINRNILLDEMELYNQYLQPGGQLVLSGFHQEDIPMLVACGKSLGLKYLTETTEGAWAMLVLSK